MEVSLNNISLPFFSHFILLVSFRYETICVDSSNLLDSLVRLIVFGVGEGGVKLPLK